jgi:hypothetical protein
MQIKALLRLLDLGNSVAEFDGASRITSSRLRRFAPSFKTGRTIAGEGTGKTALCGSLQSGIPIRNLATLR